MVAFPIDQLPDSQSLPAPRLENDADFETYDTLRTETFGGYVRHQVLGYPTPVQNNEMEEECQSAFDLIHAENPEKLQQSVVTDWKLLLQLDTDDDTGWMWGDVGTLYFWVREQDARQCDFSKVWMVFQCC